MGITKRLCRALLPVLILALFLSAPSHLHRCPGTLCPVCQAAHLALAEGEAQPAAFLLAPLSFPEVVAIKIRTISMRTPVEKCDKLTV